MKKVIRLSFIFLFLFGCSCKKVKNTVETAAGFRPASDKIVLAYTTSWSEILPDPLFVTHINYAFGHVNSTFDGIRIDNEERLKSIIGLKNRKPTLKILLSVGGWGSGRFSEMAATERTRKSFAADCKRIVDELQLDGIDIDWEYPTSSAAGISSSPDDTRNYTLLMQEIRAAVGASKLLTLASPAGAKYYDFKSLVSIVDFVNIMTYDMGNPPRHHSALYPSDNTRMSGREAVDAHIEAGFPIERLVYGVPFYGRASGGLPDFIPYKDIVELKTGERKWDDTAKNPYLVNSEGEIVCVYDDPESLEIKCAYILERGMAGVMYWDYAGDDANGTLQKILWQKIRN
ncbi:MAG: glycoside hydrolase family 18 protein [Prevotellaceae bacterium]|jgi:chitinase|nr:glycoside hydrolase family 18 protein [Prevotellaceae bacterium]